MIMADYILLVDDQGDVAAELGKVLAGSDVRAVVTDDLGAAKRKMIQAVPALVIVAIEIKDQGEVGYKFCCDLQQHSELFKIPAILIGEVVTEQSVLRAKECGAKAYYSRQVKADDLYRAIVALAAHLKEQLKFCPASDDEKTFAVNNSEQETFLLVLLARILNNINSSGILEFCSRGQVTDLLMDMTRLICENEKERVSGEQVADISIETFSLKNYLSN